MDRYTEYHVGVPVIRDKELLPEVLKKLATLEDHLGEVREIMCDEYCQYPYRCPNQETLDNICEECKLAELFKALS